MAFGHRAGKQGSALTQLPRFFNRFGIRLTDQITEGLALVDESYCGNQEEQGKQLEGSEHTDGKKDKPDSPAKLLFLEKPVFEHFLAKISAHPVSKPRMDGIGAKQEEEKPNSHRFILERNEGANPKEKGNEQTTPAWRRIFLCRLMRRSRFPSMGFSLCQGLCLSL